MEANDQKDMGNEPQHIETSGQTITWTEEEEKALVKKIDLFLMPTIWLMYLLSYMDRTNIGNAKIAGMADDIGLSSSQYSIVLVVFFIGYVIFEPPSNVILVRTRPSLYLPFIMALWGVLTYIMSVVKEYHHLIVLRVFVIVGSSTLSYFYPTLVHGLGFTSTVQAQYMTVPIYAFAFVCTAITGYFGDKIPDHRGLVIAAWLAFSMITSIIVCVVYNFTARYVLLVLMAAGLWASNAMSLSLASSTFGSMDAEVRAIALALMNALGNLAQIYGACLFPTDDAPKYLMGFGVISGMLGFGTVVYVIMHILVRRWKP
ncbi:MFS transporter prlL [Colletotrichum sp. SAR11_59]|nr:MFS transporter prlL [Colletotrichum sp. SAR11_59]